MKYSPLQPNWNLAISQCQVSITFRYTREWPRATPISTIAISICSSLSTLLSFPLLLLFFALPLSFSVRCSVYTFDLHILTNVLWHLTRIESGIEWNHARQKGVALLTLCWLCWLSVKTFAVSPRRVLRNRGGKRERGKAGSKGSQRTQKGSTKQQKSPQCLEMCEKIEWICMKFKWAIA